MEVDSRSSALEVEAASRSLVHGNFVLAIRWKLVIRYGSNSSFDRADVRQTFEPSSEVPILWRAERFFVQAIHPSSIH